MFLKFLMKYLNGKYYVEVNQKKYLNTPMVYNVSQKQKEPKSVGVHYHDISDAQAARNQKVIKNENDESEVKPNPKGKSNKKQKIAEKPKLDIECPLCRNRNWIEFDSTFEFDINKQKHQIDEKKLGKMRFFLRD